MPACGSPAGNSEPRPVSIGEEGEVQIAAHLAVHQDRYRECHVSSKSTVPRKTTFVQGQRRPVADMRNLKAPPEGVRASRGKILSLKPATKATPVRAGEQPTWPGRKSWSSEARHCRVRRSPADSL